MNILFKLNEVLEVDLTSGYYNIYIVGGFYVEFDSNFCIKIKKLENDNCIDLNEIRFKSTDVFKGERIVKCFTFEIKNTGKYIVSAHNYENLILKRSKLSFFSFSNNDNLDLDEIKILIK